MAEQLHYFTARGANLEALRSKAPRILLAGPAGTGKTRVLLEKAHQLCLRTPKVKCLVARQTLVSLTASGVQTYKKDVAPEALADGSVVFFGGSISEPPAFRYSNGSSISLGGLNDPMRIMSTEYDWIYVIEATEVSVEALDMLATRLRNGRLSFHQLALDCNPDSPKHPLKVECDEGRMVMLHSKHEDNPRFFKADGTMTDAGKDYMRTLDALTGVRYLRLRKGIWAAAEGVIYDQWQDATHLVPRFVPPPFWTRIWAVDFGYVHPFVWQEWVIDPDGRMFLYREIFHTKRLVEDHARQIRALKGLGPIERDARGEYRAQPYEGPPVAEHDCVMPRVILCDHDAEDRATLERHLGMGTTPANKNVSEGIQAVQARTRILPDGKPRIMIMKDACVERDRELIDSRKPASTAEEIGGYIWLDHKVKDQPLKEFDDGCDAMRYATAEEDLHGVTRVRWG